MRQLCRSRGLSAFHAAGSFVDYREEQDEGGDEFTQHQGTSATALYSA